MYIELNNHQFLHQYIVRASKYMYKCYLDAILKTASENDQDIYFKKIHHDINFTKILISIKRNKCV